MEVETAHPGGLEDAAVEALAEGIARALGMELPERLAHRYAPQGLSFVRHGSEGRLAIHTWPERGVATIDVWALQGLLHARWEGLSDWLAGGARYRVVEARLHHHPRGPLALPE